MTTRRRTIALVFSGVITMSVIIYLVSGSAAQVLIGIVSFAIAGGVIAAVIAAASAERKRAEALGTAIVSSGFSVDLKPDAGAKAAAFAPISHIPALRQGSRGVAWHASGQAGDRAVEAVEHHYIVHTGKSAHAVHNTIFSTPCPPAWPGLSLSPERLIHRIGEVFGVKDIQLEDAAFNRRWRIKGDDENFAALVLTPEVQQWLAASPVGESWVIGNGRICLIRHGRIKPAELGPAVSRVVEFAGLLPAELGAWTPADSPPSPRA